MSIIVISRCPFSRGAEIAEQVARDLGYRCVAREVLFETAKMFGVRREQVLQAVHDAPSFSDRFLYARERYVAFFEAALLEVMRDDDIVYHGLAGHFFVQKIRHALKVRIMTSIEERVQVLTGRESVGPRNAARIISREDNARRKWSRHLYGVDTSDPALYNMVLNIEDLSVSEASAIICRTVEMERFQTTAESRSGLDDLAIAAHVKAILIQTRPDVQVVVDGAQVTVTTVAVEGEETDLRDQIKELALTVPGVKSVTTHIEQQVRYFD